MELGMKWNPAMVLLSYGVSTVGAYVAVSLCEQYRLSRTHFSRAPKRTLNANVILALTAISLGGVGVWCMHFVGMGALVLIGPDNEEIEVRYDIGLTIASIFAVVACLFLGLLIASRDRAYLKSKEQILAMIVEDASQMGVKISNKNLVILVASLKSPFHLIGGGIVTATGVCIMHYLGMMSQRFDGKMEWNGGIIAVSVVIAIAVSTIAFWILFRLLSLYPYMESLRVASAMVMGLAVNSMHYTGLYGAKYIYVPEKLASFSEDSLLTSGIALSSALVLSMGLSWFLNILVMRDIRAWHRHCLEIINKTDDLFRKATLSPNTNVGQFITKYTDFRGLTIAPALTVGSIAGADPINSIKPMSVNNAKMSAVNVRNFSKYNESKVVSTDSEV